MEGVQADGHRFNKRAVINRHPIRQTEQIGALNHHILRIAAFATRTDKLVLLAKREIFTLALRAVKAGKQRHAGHCVARLQIGHRGAVRFNVTAELMTQGDGVVVCAFGEDARNIRTAQSGADDFDQDIVFRLQSRYRAFFNTHCPLSMDYH